MDINSYVHKSVEILIQILGLVEVWTLRSKELSPFSSLIHGKVAGENVLLHGSADGAGGQVRQCLAPRFRRQR
jgi:hypothetical protein